MFTDANDSFYYDFGSIEGVKSIASYHGLKVDHEKHLKKGRNGYLYYFVMEFGDQLPLTDILRMALSFTTYTYDYERSEKKKDVILFMLGVTDKKGKVIASVEDGCSGWFRVSSDIERSCEFSDEFYLTVDKAVASHFFDQAHGKDLELSAHVMAEYLLGWTKMMYVDEIVTIIFEKSLYYILFDHELKGMKNFIQKYKLWKGKKKDKQAEGCIAILDAIIASNSLLPKGFNERSQKQIDKIFNIKDAGMGSVPFFIDFGIMTDEEDCDTRLPKVVTPDKKKGSTDSTKRPSQYVLANLPKKRQVLKKKGNKCVDDGSDDDKSQESSIIVDKKMSSSEKKNMKKKIKKVMIVI